MISKVEDIFEKGTEGYSDIVDLISTIPLINYMVSENRKTVKDMPKDSKGRVIVDFSKPHILENMDYFTEARRNFLATGKYCHFYPSKNPNSPYKKFWDEEIRRCLDGHVRPDGEWIPGYYYYYLNYSQIELVKRKDKDSRRSYKVKTFPDIWDGDYLFFHYVEKAEELGLHGAVVKARRKGYSYKLASMLQRNYFLIQNSKSFAFASSKEYLIIDGILNKADMNFNFVNEHCGFSKKLALKDTIMHRVSGYKKPGDATEYGFKSERIGVTLSEDPDKARGKSGKLVAWEESGSNPNLLTSWNISLESVKQGESVFGFQVAFGTGGDDSSQFYGLEQLFYHPDAYEIYGIQNVFDKNAGRETCGLFIPDYLNRDSCYDENGNSDVIKAIGEVIKMRLRVRKSSNDTQYLTKRKAEVPFTPQEAFARTKGSEFPVEELQQHLAEISPSKERFLSEHYVVDLYWAGADRVEYKPNFEKQPIREWPYKGTDLRGAVELFEKPQYSEGTKEVPKGRYIAGCLLPGEKVLTDSGLKSVENVMYTDKLINEKGDIVAVKQLLEYNKMDETVYTIKVANTLRTTTFTGEHPILVSTPKTGYVNIGKCHREGLKQRYHKFDFNYKKVEEVTIKDWIKVPNIYKKRLDDKITDYWVNNGNRVDRLIDNPLWKPSFWWFIGLWLGDGWCESNGSTISISFNKNEVGYIEKCKHIITDIFKRKYSIVENSENCIEIQFSFKQLHKFLTSNFGKCAIGKRLPEWCKYMAHGLKRELVLGYLDSDGCITKNKDTYYSIEFVSINLELLESFQDILFSLGFISSITKLRKAKSGFIQGKKVNQNECYHLRLAHRETIRLVQSLNRYEDEKIQRIDFNNLPIIRDANIDCYLSDDLEYIYFRIQKIDTTLYTGKVYNFECETHTYMCHHITTHNCDPVDDDTYKTYNVSLFCIQVFDLWSDVFVAEWIGRYPLADDNFEIALKLAVLYNADINYENKQKGLYDFMNRRNKLNYLAETPSILKDMDYIKDNRLIGNRSFGTPPSLTVNAWARKQQADWMRSPNMQRGEEYTDSNGDVKTTYPLGVKTLRSFGYIKECISWSLDENFDRVSAANMVFILRADRRKFIDIKRKELDNEVAEYDNDPFFTTNYPTKQVIPDTKYPLHDMKRRTFDF